MGSVTTLTSSDGHSFEVYEAAPDGNPMGTIVVVQEIFGVNAHIREVADGYARAGYRAMAPALFDRVEPKIELGYAGADMMQGIEIARGKLDVGDALLDSDHRPIGQRKRCCGIGRLLLWWVDGVSLCLSGFGSCLRSELLRRRYRGPARAVAKHTAPIPFC